MSSPLRAGAGRVVDAVAVSERRRVLVALGLPFVFWLAVHLSANLGILSLALAGALAAYLYTRRTARATLTAGFAGAGLLLIALFLLQLYLLDAGGSTESLSGAAERLAGWVLSGAVLLALGASLSGIGRREE
ncbi:hypothetical protein [Halogeometricum luteum]|uniref:Uncharacterized protein n=1 Tax=Halogeometricum luteum TaxID=2950537 RepID=A0ABU2FY56_9EURY|nr:hypothetical protein [Halogeometricum sp. S3BR5-2]MDS0293470.1 hypothetical protein [Halogeometricum sp. S3BR5-2]